MTIRDIILSEHAMVANLGLGVWQGYKPPKPWTEDVKRIVELSKKYVGPVHTKANAVRTHFYEHTLLWKEAGDRLLPATMYDDFITSHTALLGQLDVARELFVHRDYPMLLGAAEFHLVADFDPEVFPRLDEIASRFYCRLEIDPLPEAADFRVMMEAVERVKREIEANFQARVQRASDDLWGRVRDALAHFAERMGNPVIFRDATHANLMKLSWLVPRLNVLNDPVLNELAERIATSFGGSTIEIRKNEELRNKLARKANQLLGEFFRADAA